MFKRVIEYSELEFAWYIENPDKYKLILNAFIKGDTEIHKKIEVRYGTNEQNIYYKLLENVDTAQLKWDNHKTIDILKWFLKGFKEDFISRLQSDNNTDIDTIKNEFVMSLTEHMEILKTGFIK